MQAGGERCSLGVGRRAFLRAAVMSGGAALLAACAAPSPSARSVTPTASGAQSVPSPSAAVSPSPAAAQVAPTASGGQPTTRIRFGILGAAAADRAISTGLAKGYFAAQGLDVQPTKFQSAVDMVPLLSTGQLEAGNGAASAGLFNAFNRGVNVRIVSNVTVMEPGKKNSLAILVRKGLEAETTDYSSMKGRRVAINGKGQTNYAQLVKALNRGNLSIDDVELSELAFPDMLPAMGNNVIDMALELEPLLSVAASQNIGNIWKDAADFWPNNVTEFLFFGDSLLSVNSDVGQRFAVAYVQGMRFCEQAQLEHAGQMWNEYLDIVTQETPQQRGLYANVGLSLSGSGLNSEVSLDSLDEEQSIYVDHQFVQQPQVMSQLVDTSYGKYVVQALGRV